MRKRPSWMTVSDESILELLEEKGVALKPAGIRVNLALECVDISKRTIYRRLEILDNAGMIEEPEDWSGYWRVTDLSALWLQGDLDVDDVRDQLRDVTD